MDKEKFERIDAIKERATCLVEAQINGDIQNVDAKELGEIADIVKDMAETKKLCMEAKYYESVVDAMEEAEPDRRTAKMHEYMPETRGYYGDRFPKYPIMYYGDKPVPYARRRDSRGRFMYGGDMMPLPLDYLDYGYDDWDYTSAPGGRMYYDEFKDGLMPMYQRDYRSIKPNNEQWRDPREGKSGMRRKMYMEMKDFDGNEDKQHEELDAFMRDLGSDMTEMLMDAPPEDIEMVKHKLTTLISKLN